MMPHGSRFVSYFIAFLSHFVAFPKQKKPLSRLLCRFHVSRDAAALYVQLSVSLSIAWSLSPEMKPLFQLLCRSLRRLQ
jgi:hypothetical protein